MNVQSSGNGTAVGKALVQGTANPEAKSLVVDVAQKTLDNLVQDGVLKEIPVIKSVIAFCKTWQAVHDQLFFRKVEAFLLACPEFTEAEKARFLEEELKDPKSTKQLGDALVLILDKLDDLEKPAILAKIFAAKVRGQVDYADFRRLAVGVNSAFVGDLKRICIEPLPREANSDQFWAPLEPSGFAGTAGGVSRGHAIGTRTDINSLGKLFRKCILEN